MMIYSDKGMPLYTPTSSSSSARRRIRAPSMGRMNTSSASSSSDSPFESSASLSLLASPSAHGGVSAAAAGGLGYSPSHGTGSGGVGTLGGGGGGSRFTRRGQGRGVSPGGGREAFGEEVASDLRSMAFSTVAGVISTSDQEKFARALFRSMRGNAYTYFQPADVRNFPPEYASTLESKSLFVTYYQGGRSPSSAAYEKVMRLCAAFNARCYVWPTSYEEARRRLSEVDTLLVDKAKALKAYENYFLSEIAVLLEPVDLDGTRDLEEEEDRDDMMVNERRMLGGRGGIGGTPRARRRKRRSLIEEWRRFCVKEKAIYTTLNYFEASDVTIRADCWFLTYEEAKLRLVIAEQSNRSHASAFLLLHESPPRASSSPPTYFRLPPFLLPFQQLVDTYGVPRYKEANPAIFACVFFPFLFGIMYGDVGHGVVLLLIAAALFYIKAHNGRYFHMKGE
ncbi:vacuolar proton translocating atpase subunit, partial [Cystoisospora suis]